MKWFLVAALCLVVVSTVGCVATEGANNPALANAENTTENSASTVQISPTTAPAPLPSFTPTKTPVPLITAPAGHPATPEATTAAISPTVSPTSEGEETATPTDLPASTVSTAEGANTEELVTYGLQVYKGQYCGVCHKLDAAGTGGLFGPEQNNIGTTAAQRIQDPDYTGTATTAAEYIRESIVNPQAYLVKGFEQSRHHMPAFSHLSDDELNALVQLLLLQQ